VPVCYFLGLLEMGNSEINVFRFLNAGLHKLYQKSSETVALLCFLEMLISKILFYFRINEEKALLNISRSNQIF
jgi:hypothetical protein